MLSCRSLFATLVLVLALAASAPAQDMPADAPPADAPPSVAPPADAPPSVAPIGATEVPFIDFATVDPSALCGRLASSSAEDIANVRRFAAFEAINNSRGAADKARAIVDCIDGSGMMDSIAPDPGVGGEEPLAPATSGELDLEALPEP